MREIKFRAWDKEKKEMRFFDIKIQRMSYHNELILCKAWGYNEGHPHTDNEPESFSELMQFTGLQDKNGKDIYEGDILLNEDGMGDVWVCEFKDGMFIFRLPMADVSDHEESAYVPSGFKVLGNIFENPELTKEEPK